jgi:hypothetical protein
MPLNPQNKEMVAKLGKDLIRNEAEKIKVHIENVNTNTDPKKLADTFTECDKSIAEITFRLNQLKELLQPKPKISN